MRNASFQLKESKSALKSLRYSIEWMEKIGLILVYFLTMPSGNWRFHSVLSLDLHTVKYVSLGGSSYIPLPRFLAAKKAIINLKNKDDECIKLAMTRALNPVQEHSERIDKILRETSKVLNWEGLKFSVNLNDINKFENHNSSISVTVFCYENRVYPLRIS